MATMRTIFLIAILAIPGMAVQAWQPFDLKDMEGKRTECPDQMKASLLKAGDWLNQAVEALDKVGAPFSAERFVPSFSRSIRLLQEPDQKDEITARLQQDMDAIETRIKADQEEVPPSIFYGELNQRQYDRFVSFFDQLKRNHPDAATVASLDDIRHKLEQGVGQLMQAILIDDSDDPQEVLQYQLEAQRLFKAECYLRLTRDLEEAVRPRP